MSTKKFAIKTTINAVVFIALTVILFLIFQNTALTNDIALGQMSNSNEAYLLMQHYEKVRTIYSTAYGVISILLAWSTACDVEKFNKNKGENEE